MVGWPHGLNGQEFEQAPGDGEGQGSLVCCSPWGRKESDTTERLNATNKWKRRHREQACGPGDRAGGRERAGRGERLAWKHMLLM